MTVEVSRYEVRGSSLYDNSEQRPISIFEAGNMLNTHAALRKHAQAMAVALNDRNTSNAEATRLLDAFYADFPDAEP